MKFLEDLAADKNSPQLIPRFKQAERKLLSIFMSLLEISPHIRGTFFNHCGYSSGRRCSYQSHMEVSYKGSKYKDIRPDGLIICSRGKSTWSAFLEAKAEQKEIRADQIQDYIDLAALTGVTNVITISNEFARQPSELPYRLPANKRKGVLVHHFAWADIRTMLELERSNNELSTVELALMEQCLNYFWHEGSGVLTYDAMPKEWPSFVEAASTALGFNQNVKGFADIVYGWQQERRDLCSKLTHLLHGPVDLRHKIGVRATDEDRLKADRVDLANDYQLSARYYFPSSKTLMDLTADLRACRTTVSLEVASPEGKGAKANATWLARSLTGVSSDLSIVFDWPGKNNDLHLQLAEFLAEPTLASDGQKAPPRQTKLILSVHGVRRFKSRKLFIEDVEATALEMVNLGKSTGLLPA